MARRYGNAGNVSSLISSARSAYEKTQAYQDQIEGYKWELSAKTSEDADAYVGYLKGRAKTYEGIDPSKALTFESKARSAQKSFMSAQQLRWGAQVMEGSMSNTQKYQNIKGLYQQALDTGDLSTAQQLYSTLDRLSITMQNEQIAAGNAAEAASNKAYAATKSDIDSQFSKQQRATIANDLAFKNKEISGEQYVTNKLKLTQDKDSIYSAIFSTNPDGSITAKANLKPEQLDSYYAAMNTYHNSSEYAQLDPNGKPAKMIMDGITPFNVRYDQKKDQMVLEDKPVVGANYGADGKYQNVYGNMIDGNKYSKAFSALGFDTGAVKINEGKAKFTKDNKTYDVFVDNPDNPTFAYYVSPDGKIIQINADGSQAEVKPDQFGNHIPTLDTPKFAKSKDGSVSAFISGKNLLYNQSKQNAELSKFSSQLTGAGYKDLADKAAVLGGQRSTGLLSGGLSFGGPGIFGRSTADTQKEIDKLRAEYSIREQAKADAAFRSSLPQLPAQVKPAPTPQNTPSVVWKAPTAPVVNKNGADGRASSVIQDYISGSGTGNFNRFAPSPTLNAPYRIR